MSMLSSLLLVIIASLLGSAPYSETSWVPDNNPNTMQTIREAMQRPDMFGGDMAGGLGVPTKADDGDSPVAGFMPNSRFTFWPNGIMYYEFNTSAGTGFNQSIFDEAIAEIESKTCIKIKNRAGNSSIISYVMVTSQPGGGCYSYVGMDTLGVFKQLNLQPNGCWWKGIVIHELLHALGFKHEHQRYDRDNYILVNMTNVRSGSESQFTLISQTDTYSVGIMPYDINSIMHYEWNSFGIPGSDGQLQQTIFVLNNMTFKIQHIAFRPSLSPNDAAMINAVYNCLPPTNTSTSTTSTTPTSTSSSTSTSTTSTPTTSSTTTTARTTTTTRGSAGGKFNTGFMRQLWRVLFGWMTILY